MSDAPPPSFSTSEQMWGSTSGIVHLGLGAFARAFVCPFVADAMAASGGEWGIIGVSLRSPDIRDALRPRDWAYSSVTLDAQGEVIRDITVLDDVLVAPENPVAVLTAMAAPTIKIVTLTVTEKGYCHHPATGTLNTDHPDIQYDLTHDLPVSALGYLVRALQLRHAAGDAPFTVLCCDNLPGNGALLRGLVLEMAGQLDPVLATWIADFGRFPSTMVDRITPATTAPDIARISAALGFDDAAPVLHEAFAQWVIEDDFVAGARPDLAGAGAELVADVTPFEEMKLRMLNGTHSALAYTGYLAGFETISDTVADPAFAQFTRLLWSEITPAVTVPAGVSLEAYAQALFERYANPAVRHKTWQIAMDGSQKLPQRLLGTLRHDMDAGRDTRALCLAVAAWMRYVSGPDEAGAPIDLRDPMADELRAVTADCDGPAQVVAALLALDAVFPPDLATRLQGPVTQAAGRIWSLGTHQAVKELTQ